MGPIVQEARAVRVTTEENTNLYTSRNEVLKGQVGAPPCLFYVFAYSFTWRRRVPAETGAGEATEQTVFSEFLQRVTELSTLTSHEASDQTNWGDASHVPG